MAEPGAAGALRLVRVAGAVLLAVDVGLTALLLDRLPTRIAVHWTASGVADGAGHRDLAWLFPLSLAFVVGLALVVPRHTAPHERGLLAGALALAGLYLFSTGVLLLLANLDGQRWQDGSVGAAWMLLVLLAPALVLAGATCAYRAASRA